jgi:hypothetical protein
MRTYQEEIFGPVLQIARDRDFEEALALPSKHQYGNGVAIFHARRRHGARIRLARERRHGRDQRADSCSLAYYSFGGWKRSVFGDANQHGPDGVRFFTRVKTVTARLAQGRRAQRQFQHAYDALMTFVIVRAASRPSPRRRAHPRSADWLIAKGEPLWGPDETSLDELVRVARAGELVMGPHRARTGFLHVSA